MKIHRGRKKRKETHFKRNQLLESRRRQQTKTPEARCRMQHSHRHRLREKQQILLTFCCDKKLTHSLNVLCYCVTVVCVCFVIDAVAIVFVVVVHTCFKLLIIYD